MRPVFAQILQQNKFCCVSITCHVVAKTILSVGFNLAATTTMTIFPGVPRNNYILKRNMFSFAGRLLANDRLFPYLNVTTNNTFYLPRTYEDKSFSQYLATSTINCSVLKLRLAQSLSNRRRFGVLECFHSLVYFFFKHFNAISIPVANGKLL